MHEETARELEEIQESLFSLARAHRDVIPPPEATATALTQYAGQIRDLVRRERALTDDPVEEDGPSSTAAQHNAEVWTGANGRV